MIFTEEHLWLLEEDEVVTVGLTEFGQSVLGSIGFLELPETGDKISTDDVIAVAEGNDDAMDILAPLDGEVVDVNNELLENPTLVNEDPTGRGWLFRMEVDDLLELEDFLSEAEYRKLTR